MSSMDPSSSKRKEAKDKSEKVLSKLGLNGKDLDLNEHEQIIAAEISHPDEIDVLFKGELTGAIAVSGRRRRSRCAGRLTCEDRWTCRYRRTRSHHFPAERGGHLPAMLSAIIRLGGRAVRSAQGSAIVWSSRMREDDDWEGESRCRRSHPREVKRDLADVSMDRSAQALAKESGATFINIRGSILTNKWFGESNKLVSALFSLAKKLQPTIIFIDEIDSMMRERSSNDHEVTGMMYVFLALSSLIAAGGSAVEIDYIAILPCRKAEFMTLWDGLATGNDARILVLGATNRPNDIDSAILRRMPKRFAIKLPDAQQRKSILTLVRRPASLSR